MATAAKSKSLRNTTPQEIYDRAIANGATPKLAEMLAARKAPGIGLTDSIFMAGRWNGSAIHDEHVANEYRGMARAAGVNPNGKTYCSQLAAYPGDPRAWVDSVADVKARAAERGLTLEGGISYTPPDALDSPVDDLSGPYRVADDVVDEAILSDAEDNPELAAEWDAHPEKLEEKKEEYRKTFSGEA